MSNRLEHGPRGGRRKRIIRKTRRALPLIAAISITMCVLTVGWLTH